MILGWLFLNIKSLTYTDKSSYVIRWTIFSWRREGRTQKFIDYFFEWAAVSEDWAKTIYTYCLCYSFFLNLRHHFQSANRHEENTIGKKSNMIMKHVRRTLQFNMYLLNRFLVEIASWKNTFPGVIRKQTIKPATKWENFSVKNLARKIIFLNGRNFQLNMYLLNHFLLYRTFRLEKHLSENFEGKCSLGIGYENFSIVFKNVVVSYSLLKEGFQETVK